MRSSGRRPIRTSVCCPAAGTRLRRSAPLSSSGVGNGVTTQFQLVRSKRTWTEPVFALSGVPEVTVNGIAVTNYIIAAPGVIKFDSAPADGDVVAWSGSFLYWCEFTQDELTGKEAAARLMELGHDPRRFSLTADGEDTAEERAAKTPADSPQVRRTVRLLRDAIAVSRTGKDQQRKRGTTQ